MYSSYGDSGSHCRVSPFGDPWIYARFQLPMAFRRSLRPSSATGAKASSLCSCSLEQALYGLRPRSLVIGQWSLVVRLRLTTFLPLSSDSLRFLCPHNLTYHQAFVDKPDAPYGFTFWISFTLIPICLVSSLSLCSFQGASSQFSLLSFPVRPSPFRTLVSPGSWAEVDSNHRPHAYQACALTG